MKLNILLIVYDIAWISINAVSYIDKNAYIWNEFYVYRIFTLVISSLILLFKVLFILKTKHIKNIK